VPAAAFADRRPLSLTVVNEKEQSSQIERVSFSEHHAKLGKVREKGANVLQKRAERKIKLII